MNSKYRFLVLPGDGIGPEVTSCAVEVLKEVSQLRSHEFEFTEADIGAVAIDRHGTALPEETLAQCRQSDAVFMGAVGSPKYGPGSKVKPEDGLLRLRKELGLFANIRPVRPERSLLGISAVKEDRLRGTDLVFVRELTGGIYFGQPKRCDDDEAVDTCVYTRAEIERVSRVAFKLAEDRTKRVMLVDKANVMATSALWRRVVTELAAREFPHIALETMLVDAFAMRLIDGPTKFDVIVTENLFGDILTDEAAVLVGSLGMLPSASLGEGTLGLYEPVHGSAPDIAGKGIANPYGAILSAAMMLRHSCGLDDDAQRIDQAVTASIRAGIIPRDLAAGAKAATTRECMQGVIDSLRARISSAV